MMRAICMMFSSKTFQQRPQFPPLARSLWWAAATFGLHAFSFLCSCYVFWTSKLCERKRRVETIHDRFNYVLISGFGKSLFSLDKWKWVGKTNFKIVVELNSILQSKQNKDLHKELVLKLRFECKTFASISLHICSS